MEPVGPIERRLLYVERGLMAMAGDLRKLKLDQLAISQGIWDDASTITRRGTPTPTPTPTTNTTFTIHVQGCIAGNLGGVGATVAIALGGTTLYSGGVTNGTSDLTDSFYSPTPGSSYTWTVTPAGARQSTQTFTRALSAGVNASFTTASLTAASGYVCMISQNQLPPKTGLTMVDSAPFGDGTFTITRSSGSSIWFKAFNPNSYWMDNAGAFFLNGTTARTGAATTATWTDSGALHVVFTIKPGQGDATHPVGTTFTITEP